MASQIKGGILPLQLRSMWRKTHRLLSQISSISLIKHNNIALKDTVLGGFLYVLNKVGKKKLCRERVSVGKEFILFFLTLLTLMRVCEKISVNN